MSDYVLGLNPHVRNVARGVTMGPEGIMYLLGARESAQGLGDWMNRQLGTTNARLDTDPVAFAEQNLGAALLGIPAGPLAAVGRAAPWVAGLASRFPRTIGALEATTPLTLPLNPTRVALNAAGGAAVGGVLEEVADKATEGAPVRAAGQMLPVEEVQPTPQPLPSAVQPVGEMLPIDNAPVTTDAPAPEGAQPVGEMLPVDDRTRGEKLMEYWPYALVGGLGIWGARQAAQRAAANAAIQQTGVVAPGSPRNPDADMGSAPTRAATALVDEGAIAREPIREGVERGVFTPERGEQLMSSVDLGANLTARQAQVTAVHHTGVLPSGHRIGRSMREITGEWATVQRRDPDQWARLQEAAAIRDELSNRLRAADLSQQTTKGINPATGTPDLVPRIEFDAEGTPVPVRSVPKGGTRPRIETMVEPARVGMTDVHYNDLVARLSALSTDPLVRQTAVEFRDRAARYRMGIVREGYMTQQEANRLARANPFYLPTFDPDDVQGRHFTLRKIEEGGQPERGQDALQAWADYEGQFVAITQHNRAKREVANALHELQQARTAAGDRGLIVGRIMPADTPYNSPDILTFREGGERKQIEVYTPGIAQVMRNDPKAVVPFANWLRKNFQFFTTGPGAAIAGPIFAFKSGWYNFNTALATRGGGMAAGLFDKASQDAGGPGIRADPTFLLQTLTAAPRDFAAVGARELAAGLRRTPFTGMADSLARLYEQSTLAVMQRHGALQTGQAYGGDYASRIRADLGEIDPRYDATRGVNPGPPKTVEEHIDWLRMKGYTYTPAVVRKAWQLYKEALDIVSNAPQSALWRANEGRFRQRYADAGMDSRAANEALARRVRQSGGDPSISGASRSVQAYASMIPFGNVFVQSLNTWGKAFHENFAGTALAAANMIFWPALLGAYTAKWADEEAIAKGEKPSAVQDRIMGGSGQNAGALRFYLPGQVPEDALHFWYEPVLAPGAVVANAIINRVMGLDNPRYFTSEGAHDREVLTRMVMEADTRTWWEASTRAFLQFAVPPPLAAIGAAQGVDLNDLLNFGAARGVRTRSSGAPGFERGATFGDPINPTMGAMAEAMFGATATVVQTSARTAMAVTQATGSVGQGLAAAREVRAMSMEDRLNTAPRLWEGPRRVSGYDIAAEAMADAERRMREIGEGKADWQRPGTIGSGNAITVPTLGPGRRPPDRELVPVLQQFDALYAQQKNLRDERNSYKEQIVSLRSNGYRMAKPREVRMYENLLNDGIREVNDRLFAQVVQKEQELSRLYSRRIRLDQLDPTRGLDQFPAITPQAFIPNPQ